MMNTKKYSRHEEDRLFKLQTGQLKGTGKRNLSEGVYAIRDKTKLVKRTAGFTLVPTDIPNLVQAALASGGPIQQGEPFEHLLALTCDNYRFYAYHFIVSPAGAGPRRAMLLSERTVHGNVSSESRFGRQLLEYAEALGSPRVIMNQVSFCCDLASFLIRDAGGALRFRGANFGYKPTEPAEQARHLDNASLAFELYANAVEGGALHHPIQRSLSLQRGDVRQQPDARGRLSLRGMPHLERDQAALCMVMLEELHEKHGAPLMPSLQALAV